MQVTKTKNGLIKSWSDPIESEAQTQVENVSNMPFISGHVAVMPDAHAGKGSTVGTVIATNGAIIPSAVGVDCGCGMLAIRLDFLVDDIKNVANLRSSIEAVVPVGFRANAILTDSAAKAMTALSGIPVSQDVTMNTALQLGTLGGGNHFIEMCSDLEGHAWLMLHTGSRNIGKTLAEKHINKAKDLMKQYFIDLPDPDLAYLAQGTVEFDSYIQDLNWAQMYAKQNRLEIKTKVLDVISTHVFGEHRPHSSFSGFCVDCHHNYTSKERHMGKNLWITRKGAVSAKRGEFGIIPGSMGAKSFIVAGKGNRESFKSCSHGAGRVMSRAQAKKQFSLADFEAQTTGVESRKDVDLIDEIPSAYKNIDRVMENQKDLVDVVFTLKQFLCIKG